MYVLKFIAASLAYACFALSAFAQAYPPATDDPAIPTLKSVTGRSIYRPLNEGDGVNVFRFSGPEDLLISGHLWAENRAQLAYKPFVMAEPVGEGVVIGFTQSPTTRAYLDGLNLLLANAVVLGPARMAQ